MDNDKNSGSLSQTAQTERERIIVRTSLMGITANALIAVIKIAVGLATSSMAIVSEGINNAADCTTSALTLAGSKLAGRHPDSKHPFGYGRIEYITSLFVGMLILYTGITVFADSVKLIFRPEPVSPEMSSLIMLSSAMVLKFVLGKYTIKMGRLATSSSLEAVGKESCNDSFASLATIASVLIFLLTGKSFDAWAAAITSVLIIKTGAEVFLETLGELIGRPGQKELATTLYKEIRATEGVLNAADMMLHNYGPDKWSGSVNIEVDKSLTAGEVYRFVHALQLRIMHTYSVTMVFGIYAVDTTTPDSIKLRQTIAGFTKKHKNIIGYHAVYNDPQENRIYCDFVVDYSLKDWNGLEEEFRTYMAAFYPGKDIELTIETDFV